MTSWLELVPASELDLEGEPETLIETRHGRRLLALRHEERACVFLSEAGCTVHGNRPLSCASYPFDRPFGREHLLGLHPAPHCPTETGYLGIISLHRDEATSRDAKQFARLIETRDKELLKYSELVGVFNRRQRLLQNMGRLRQTELDFFEFLRKRCAIEARTSST